MKNKRTSMPFDEIMQNSELTHLHEIVSFLENNEDINLFPEKYNAALKQTISRKTDSLFSDNPSTPIKKVITIILESLPDSLNSDILLEMTAFIIDEWNDLTHSLQKSQNEFQMV